MPQNFSEAKPATGDRFVRFRLRNCNSTSDTQQGHFCVPYQGRIKKGYFVLEGNPSANWSADIITANGTLSKALYIDDVGHANVGTDESFYCEVSPMDDKAQVAVGDTVRIKTNDVSGSATSVYGWIVIG